MERRLQKFNGWFFSSLPPWAAGLIRNGVLALLAALIVYLGNYAVNLPPDAPEYLVPVFGLVMALLRMVEGKIDASKAAAGK